jgi:hypothetical protein
MIKQQAQPRKNRKGKGKKVQSAESVELQSRRPREPNWEHAKVLALVKAKKKEHLTRLDRVDGQDQFETIVSKWKKISEFVMDVGHSIHLRNGPACKNKWGSLFGDFKKIYDYMASTGNNQDYRFHYEYTLIHFLLCVGCLAIFFLVCFPSNHVL